MKTLRAGVGRLREELAALLGVEVGEVAGPRGGSAEPSLPDERVLVGTEAVLHRVRHAAAVSFLDIDLHLLAARLTAVEDTLALLVRAARLVGARGTGPAWARVQAQTRVPDHAVLKAVWKGEPAPVLDEERVVRRLSGLPPFAALALVSGRARTRLRQGAGGGGRGRARATAAGAGAVTVSPVDEGRFLVRAATHEPLCDLLARVPRPGGRGLRVEVDPPSV